MNALKLSPSSLSRLRLCPGSYWAEHGLPPVDSGQSAEGALLHTIMTAKDRQDAMIKAGLNHEQQSAIRYCSQAARELQSTLGEKTAWDFEARLSTTVGTGSSQAEVRGIIDYYVYDGRKAIVMDWKFGRGAIDPADSNLQTRAYALLVARHLPELELIETAIIQPRAFGEDRLSVAAHTPHALETTAVEIANIAKAVLEARDKSIGVRFPGESQCKYCRALATDNCPESQSLARDPAEVENAGLIMPRGKDLAKWLDVCAEAERKLKVAEAVIERFRTHAKNELSRNPESVPGWGLLPGSRIRTVPDVALAWDRIEPVLSPEEFMRCCRVSPVDLESQIRSKQGLTQTEAKSRLAAILGDAIVIEERGPLLKRREGEKS